MRCRFRRSAYDLLATEEVGSLGAGAHVHACACEDTALPAPGYRSDTEHRSRAPISFPRTAPQAPPRRPSPGSVDVHSRSHSDEWTRYKCRRAAPRHSPPGGAARSAVRGEHTSAAGPPQGARPRGERRAAPFGGTCKCRVLDFSAKPFACGPPCACPHPDRAIPASTPPAAHERHRTAHPRRLRSRR